MEILRKFSEVMIRAISLRFSSLSLSRVVRFAVMTRCLKEDNKVDVTVLIFFLGSPSSSSVFEGG